MDSKCSNMISKKKKKKTFVKQDRRLKIEVLSVSESVTTKSVVFPTETSTSYVEMVPQKPLSLSAFTLCMRLATELMGEREIILFAYRTQYYDELNVWREMNGR